MLKIVLASGSPRRKELMKLISDDFEVRVSNADESIPEDIMTDKAAEYAAEVKAESVAKKADEVIIGCDTMVMIDGEILGKPKDRTQCKEMLRKLSGKRHYVRTGVCLLCGTRKRLFTVTTDVEFYPITEDEIEDYMDTGEPFDKAGGYGIQGRGALLVKEITGDYFNVVGLPVSRLYRELAMFCHVK